MIAVRANSGNETTSPRGSRKRRLLASAAVALGYLLITAVPTLEPTPAAAQTFVFGGFRIHVHGMRGGGGYYRHHSGRHHASASSRRHGRRRGGGEEEETAQKPVPPQSPAAQPVRSNAPAEMPATSATRPAEMPVTSATRPAPHAPDFELSK